MREPVRDCPLCGRRMEEGFVLALDSNSHAVTQMHWIEGRPELSRWWGMRIKGRRKLPVVTFRCTGCGYLVSYAQGTT